MVQAILRATARVLRRRGYVGTSTNHIAEAAGASVGSVYEYFANKDAIFEALANAHLEKAEAHLQACFASLTAREQPVPLLEIVGRAVDAMIDLHADEPEVHHRLATEVPLSRQVRERVRALEAHIVRQVLLLLHDHPEVHAPRVELAVLLCVQTIDALTHRWFAQRELVNDAPHARRALIDLVLSVLRSPVCTQE
jgi:AcrR family transcriptional regulator